MKYLLILLMFIPLAGRSQVDSSKTKISVTITAKDCEFIVLYFEQTNKYEDIDSVLRGKFRVASPPAGNTTVQIDSIEGRVWLDIDRKMADNVLAQQNNVWKRVDDALRLTGNTWLINKLDRDANDRGDIYSNIRSAGRTYLRKQQN